MSNLAQEEADRFFNYKPSATSHPEDSRRDGSSPEPDDPSSRRGITSNRRIDLDDPDTDDEDTLRNLSTLSGTKQSYTVPTTAQYANTGPKGVIADAQNYHRAKQNGSHISKAQLSTTTQPPAPHSQPTKATSSDEEEEDLSLDDPDNDPFMSSWREKRLAELAEQYAPVSSTNSTTPSQRRTYGTLEQVTATGYLDAIESSPPTHSVIVFIFDPLNADSLEVEDELKMLAYRFNKTRFVKLHAKIAEMRQVEIPAVLVYRGGEVVVTMSGVDPGVGVEGVLVGRGILEK